MKNNKKEPININNDSKQNVATDEAISNLFFTNVSDETSSIKSEDSTNDVKSETSVEDKGNDKVNTSAEKVEENVTDVKVETSIENNGNNKTNAQIDKVKDNSTDVKPEAPVEDKVTDSKTDASIEDKVNDSKADASIEDNASNNINDNINERRNLAPKPVKTRKPIFPVVIACLILAVVVGGIAYILNNGKSSKKDSLANKPSLFEGLFDFTSPVDSAIGSTELMANYNKCGSLSSSITVDSIYADTDISGATLNTTFNHNTASKEASLDADISYRGMKLYSLLSFVNDKKIMFKIPTFNESVYTYSDKLFKNAFDSFNDTDIISLYVYAIKETYPDDFKTILSGISSVNADADSYGNKGTTYTISEDSVKLFISKLITVTFDNKELFSSIESSFDKSEINDLKKQVEYVSKNAAKAYSGDITFTVWKNKKGQLTNFDFYNSIELSGEEFDIDFSIESYDEINPADSMTFTFSILDSGNDFSIIYDRTKEFEDNTTYLSHDISILSGSDSLLELNVTEDFNADSNDYNIESTINTDTIIVLQGKFNNIKKGKSFDFDMTTFQVTQGYNNLIKLSGNLSLDTGKPKITKPSGSTVDINSLSDTEKYDLLDSISNFFTKSIED
ncbi:MAG: hypothetical protein SPL51_01375 [Lachnospiraceae bacterium]|nr:hypothetical protein [Lachnospiraceae bacterium]